MLSQAFQLPVSLWNITSTPNSSINEFGCKRKKIQRCNLHSFR
ncbi:Unknown protein sequence [Pseudomonas syringae pv. maculicola str. M6]|nr:Unknown protein sequence [Pseudomonas syringae pv. maculicola str. M6]